MFNQIALITIVTDDVPRLAGFYRDVLGFTVKQDLGGYVEFHNDGVRFAVCARSILREASGHASYEEAPRGQCFELAFPCASPAEVDRGYAEAVAQGAAPVHAPADMPWQQRTAMFADPDGNIHEFFADLPPVTFKHRKRDLQRLAELIRCGRISRLRLVKQQFPGLLALRCAPAGCTIQPEHNGTKKEES